MPNRRFRPKSKFNQQRLLKNLNKWVINLSNITLNRDQKTILCRGLSFCPTPCYDDIFIVWAHSREELDSFIYALNSFDINIKFTYNIYKKKADFLHVSKRTYKNKQGLLQHSKKSFHMIDHIKLVQPKIITTEATRNTTDIYKLSHGIIPKFRTIPGKRQWLTEPQHNQPTECCTISVPDPISPLKSPTNLDIEDLRTVDKEPDLYRFILIHSNSLFGRMHNENNDQITEVYSIYGAF